jgi:F-type H+-transporting ATPase subunit epsilon
MAEKLLEIEIVTPQAKIYSGKAESVSLPGSKSPFQVLYNHAPIVSSLEVGLIKILDDNGKNLWFACSTGFTEISKNKVSILVENALLGTEVETSKCRADIDKCLDIIGNKALGETERNNAKNDAKFASMCIDAAGRMK